MLSGSRRERPQCSCLAGNARARGSTACWEPRGTATADEVANGEIDGRVCGIELPFHERGEPLRSSTASSNTRLPTRQDEAALDPAGAWIGLTDGRRVAPPSVLRPRAAPNPTSVTACGALSPDVVVACLSATDGDALATPEN